MRAFLNSISAASLALSAAVLPQDASAMIQCGLASWYGLEAGTKRADGGSVDAGALSAAHRSLPFGTKVKVENLENGREATVEINDRGPFTAARVIDVSKGTAQELDFVADGVVRVRITTLDGADGATEKIAAKKCP
jgi:peptidoglycan lytic transglycosylase